MGEILVGAKKDFKNYLIAMSRIYYSDDEIIVKARGNAILRAINLLEWAKRNLKIKDISISTGTEEINDKDKKMLISTIEIRLKKGGE